MLPSLLLLFLQLQIPAPTGFVNDFAGVLDGGTRQRLEALCTEVRQKTGGDIAVVTLADLGGEEASDVARTIGREWKVGGTGPAGDPRNNLGVVILVVPRKNHQPGTGAVRIEVGRGAEGFLTDAGSGRIRDAMTPDLANEDYPAGIETGVAMVAGAFAKEFGVTLTGAVEPPAPEQWQWNGHLPWWVMVILVIFFIWIRIRLWPLFFFSGWGRRGGWGGGGFFSGGLGGRGGGGGFSGGFGGFGGGGGFSGGGAGGSF
ncbi:MAG TPA: TPM domain-containing protein [Gemmatimonadales bacterium]|nr:TPM domain-containing protein [Gemmatimonadales bacterium]